MALVLQRNCHKGINEMRMIKIDPYDKSITERDVIFDKKKSLSAMYNELGHDVTIVERAQFKYHFPDLKAFKSCELWLDENGFANRNHPPFGVLKRIEGLYLETFVGPALLCNNDIRPLSDKITVDMVKEIVRFQSR